jgi:cytidylate kinase
VAIITISRGSLSGGRAIAECLGHQLGYPVIAREVLQEAAGRLGVPPEDLQVKFETAPHLWPRISRERKKHALAVRAALAARCTQGDLVYHGLAGQFLLKDLPGVLRVQILAPMEKRILSLLESHPRMTRDQVAVFIKKVDQERDRWVRVMYDAEARDSAHYDLSLNLEKISLESACGAIATTASLPRFAVTPAREREILAFAEDCKRELEEALGG